MIKKMVWLIVAVVLVGTAVLAGCDSGEDLRDKVNDLEGKNQQLRDEIDALMDEIDVLMDEIDAILDENDSMADQVDALKDDYDSKLAALLDRLEALEETNSVLWESYKNILKLDLASYPMEEYYSNENWSKVTDVIDAANKEIDELENKADISAIITAAKEEIDQIQKEDEPIVFRLTMSLDSLLLAQGDGMYAKYELKNLSNESYEITYSFVAKVHTPTAVRAPEIDPPPPKTVIFKAQSSFKGTWYIGGSWFDPGLHEIKCVSNFYITRGESKEYVRVESLPAVITIV